MNWFHVLVLGSLCTIGCSAADGTHGDGNGSNGSNGSNGTNNSNSSCGVNPVMTSGDTATVAADGTVIFNAIAVGGSESFSIPVKESADTDETIVQASASGAFKVLSAFPIYVPRGGTAFVEVSFTPAAGGATSSDLVLETAKMGSSHVALTGTGL